jgi:hypothetical protein
MIVPRKDQGDDPTIQRKHELYRSSLALMGWPGTTLGKIKGIRVPSRLSFAQSSENFWSDAYCQHWLRNSSRSTMRIRNGEKDETAMRGLRQIFER